MISLGQLEDLFSELGFRTLSNLEGEILIWPVRFQGEQLHVYAGLFEQGTYVRFLCGDFPTLNGSEPVEPVLRLINAKNFENRLLKLALNHGRLYAMADLWLEDADLTRRQLARLLDSFITLTHEALVEVRAVVSANTCPPQPQEGVHA
jgi:hypothetical protein